MQILNEPVYPFKYAESCLYRYQEHKRRLETLRSELKYLERFSSSVGAQQYDAIPNSSSQPADRVSARLERILDLEDEIQRVQLKTVPVENLIKDLSESQDDRKKEMFEILEMRYLQGAKWPFIADSLSMSRNNCLSLRRELVRIAISYLGLPPCAF